MSFSNIAKKYSTIDGYLFHIGQNYRSYDFFGMQKLGDTCIFRVWAPNAKKVFLVGDFNCWEESDSLYKTDDYGVWEIIIDANRVLSGNNEDKYKYKIYSPDKILYKADPYAVRAGIPPETASIVPYSENYVWRDHGWLKFRAHMAKSYYSFPINIYGLDMKSWGCNENGVPLDYCSLARELAPYVKQMGYTHVEIMPVYEYVCNKRYSCKNFTFFSPATVYGDPNELKEFVDCMHEAGIGVVLDWIPSYFSVDEQGLSEFDGSELYERNSDEEQNNPGIRRFDLKKGEVQSFLISSADYLIREFHIDVFKVCDVGALFDLNLYRISSADFLKKLNRYIKCEFPDVITMADVSDISFKVTGTGDDGLGFDLTWNIDWMNDARLFRKSGLNVGQYEYLNLKASVAHVFSERYVLPTSNDGTVYPCSSLINGVNVIGDNCSFSMLRAFYGYALTLPGKKFGFMGSEIAQDHCSGHKSVEWSLLANEKNAQFQRFVAEFNHFYLSCAPLWQIDDSRCGFAWIEPYDDAKNVISYRRTSEDGNEVYMVINFSDTLYDEFLLEVLYPGRYKELMNSDDLRFGGNGDVNAELLVSAGTGIGNSPNSIKVKIAPFTVAVFGRNL